MKKLIRKAVLGLSAILPLAGFAQFDPIQSDEECKVHIDLTQIVDDRVKVEFVVPILMEDEVIYNMPRMVPGTYKVYDFGRFVNDLVAIGGRGDTLEVERLNTNQWKIKDAKQLYKIVYLADDTYDGEGTDIFAPAGTGFTEGVYMLNTFSFVGYLDGYKDVGFEYHVKKPEGLYGTTSLDRTSSENNVDVFTAGDYFELHDCPVLYAKPDTASVDVVGTRVTLSVHSQEGNLSAAEIMKGLEPVFHAAAEYLGGDLPAEKYTVLIYGMDLKQSMLGAGALEHHTSTVVNVPDISDQYLKMMADESMIQLLRDIVAHEFFHIVTPLNIHSQHIADYDFMYPQMSEHLWLYEGITEYNSHISQARGGIITEERFFKNMKSKMESDRTIYNDHVPFTTMSKYALNFYESQYGNVYEKGALIGMCLDLTLRESSEGAYGLADLLMELSAVYGKDTFFLDDQLFDLMIEQSGNDELGEFFARYVESSEPLPYAKLLSSVGYHYQAERTTRMISDGGLSFNVKGELVTVGSYRTNDAFIKSLTIRRRDVIVSWGDVKITPENYKQTMADFIQNSKAGEEVNVTVLRVVKGKEKKLKLSGTIQNFDLTEEDVLEMKANPTADELKLKKAWMNY
jgi:predicted metalloprotease with PDZ domain